MHNKNEYICRICGFEQKDPSWEDGIPTYNICDCCGVEFGYEDSNITSIYNYRNIWLKNGAQWFNEKVKPKYWVLNKQMKNIPEEFQ